MTSGEGISRGPRRKRTFTPGVFTSFEFPRPPGVRERRGPRASITEFKRAFEAVKCAPSALDCGEPGCEVDRGQG